VLAVALALGSSLLYGVSDFLGGLKSRTLPLLSVLLVSQGGALVALAILALALGEAPPAVEFLGWAVLAGISEAVGVAALYRGLARGKMSLVAPIAATAPAVPVAVAAVLGELPDPLQAVGILAALAGVGLIALRGGEGGKSASSAVSVAFGLLTAAGFGGFMAAMDAAAEGGVHWALLVARLTTVTVFIAVFAAIRPGIGLTPRDVPLLVMIGLLILAADALYSLASTEGLLSVVAVLSSLYPVVTIVLARIYLGERVAPIQRAGVAATLAGAALISVG
jgi:drug/metabolite transporter (DMT)-like permease